MQLTLQIGEGTPEVVYSGDSLALMEDALFIELDDMPSRYARLVTKWWEEKARPKIDQGIFPIELRIPLGSDLHTWLIQE